MIRRLVVFLIRKKLRLKAYECFRFANQKSDAVYYFSKTELVKNRHVENRIKTYSSGCSINWLLDERCKIEKLGYDATWV